jgi:hypothetical protein
VRIILLLADGARPDTLAAAIDRGDLPALARLRREGGMHELTSTFPSVTGPAYAPMLMGRFPGPVGLPGLRWYDRARTTCAFPDYSRSYVGYQMGAVDGDLDPAAPTIFELVLDSVGALSVITRGLPRHRQLLPLDLRSAVRAVSTHFRGDVSRWLEVDRDVSRALIAHVEDDAARFVFAAFPGVDKTSHADGHESPRVTEALRILDDTVAAVRQRLEARGEWADTLLWITSDHGHSEVRDHEDLAVVVEEAGFRVRAHPWVFRPRTTAAVMVSGNAMAHVYLELDRRERPFGALGAAELQLASDLVARDSVDLLLMPLDRDRCLVRSTRGDAVVRRRGDRYSYERGTGDPLGLGESLAGVTATEAYDATRHTDYPDSLVQVASITASDRAGDLILSAARDWDFRARYEPIPHRSAHGALHRDHMLVPFLTSRPLARAPRRTTDIMPTALAALGQPIPPDLDGTSAL